jgi:metal-sulfur cluster biosynthetic enzyme
MAIGARQNRFLDPDVTDCLLDVIDPEVGLSVVDLGLVYHASRQDHGIDVAMTLITQAYPLGEMIVEDARERLAARFPDASRIAVDLVWYPPWTPELITDYGRSLLAHQPNEAA